MLVFVGKCQAVANGFFDNKGFLAGRHARSPISLDNRQRTVLALTGVGNSAAMDEEEALGLALTTLLMVRSVVFVVTRGRPDRGAES